MNSYTCIGNLARDPEVRTAANGTVFCKSAVAVRTGWGENKKTLFLDFVIFGKRAEPFAKFHAKGSQCALRGALEMNEWTDKDTGQKRSKPGLVVDDWWFVGPKKEQATTPQDDDDRGWMPHEDGAPF